MKTQTKNKELRYEEGRTKFFAEHEGQDLTFIHPAYGPDTYLNVGDSMVQAGLARPTMAETASLVYSAFNSNDKYSKDIKQTMKSNWLWAFTVPDYRPKIGAFVYDEDDKEEFQSLSAKGLESMLGTKQENGAVYSEDRKLWLAPFGSYAIGSMNAYDLSKNSLVTALAKGGEGADKLAEVANKHPNKPRLWGLTSVEQPTTRVSALDSSWDLVGRLGVDGSYHWNSRGGCCFGVQKAGEASRTKK